MRRISEEDEVQLYHIICNIARTCKKYFYERKYLPSDTWSIDKVVNEILSSSKKLKSKYSEIKNNDNN